MNAKLKKSREKEFDTPAISIEKVAGADTVVGKSIITVSGTEVIPLSSVTVVNLSGGSPFPHGHGEGACGRQRHGYNGKTQGIFD